VTRRSMLRAALGYVGLGWPVVPGATPYASACRRIRVTGPDGPVWVECSCDSRYCVTPAAHPIDPHWQQHQITTAADVRWWWSARPGLLPNIVLVCGTAFHVWSMPRVVGIRVVEALPVEVARAVPVAVTPLGWWHLFCAPDGSPEELPPVPAGLGMAHLGDGCFVAAPPSTRGVLGHDMWLREPLARRRLVPCGVVATALQHATNHRAEAGRARRGRCGAEPLWRVAS
jgi:Bifunctional DNA primase/polymerase, N-terminal